MSQNGFRTRASCLAKQYSKFEVYEKKVKFSVMLHELVEKENIFCTKGVVKYYLYLISFTLSS